MKKDQISADYACVISTSTQNSVSGSLLKLSISLFVIEKSESPTNVSLDDKKEGLGNNSILNRLLSKGENNLRLDVDTYKLLTSNSYELGLSLISQEALIDSGYNRPYVGGNALAQNLALSANSGLSDKVVSTASGPMPAVFITRKNRMANHYRILSILNAFPFNFMSSERFYHKGVKNLPSQDQHLINFVASHQKQLNKFNSTAVDPSAKEAKFRMNRMAHIQLFSGKMDDKGLSALKKILTDFSNQMTYGKVYSDLFTKMLPDGDFGLEVRQTIEGIESSISKWLDQSVLVK